MKPLNDSFKNINCFENWLNRYRKIATRTWPKMSTFMLFAADRKYLLTSFQVKNVKTMEFYAVLNFKVATGPTNLPDMTSP